MMDERLHDLDLRENQVDEIWTFVQKKQARISHSTERPNPEHGDKYVFVALDAETKLVPSFVVGKRDGANAYKLVADLAERVPLGELQISSDAFPGFKSAVDMIRREGIDYAQQVKHCVGGSGLPRVGYSPAKVESVSTHVICGDPNPEKISTTYVERQNLTMRMHMRRFTRLTNGFSRKLRNLKAAVALYFAWYNFVRVHQTLSVTPAMEAGVTNSTGDVEDLLAWEAPY